MSRQGNTSEIEERLAIIERALAETTTRISELSSAIAELAQLTGPSDAVNTQSTSVGADDIAPFAVGFYQREYDPSGRAYRWTGRGNLFELRIRLNRNFEWAFKLELQRNRHVNISKLRAYVDYIEVPVLANEADGYIRGPVPSKPLGNSAILTFQLPNLFVPSQIDPASTDNRTLGVVFYEIRAEPGFSAAKGARAIAMSDVAAVQRTPPLAHRVALDFSASAQENATEPSPKRRSLAASVSRLKISL